MSISREEAELFNLITNTPTARGELVLFSTRRAITRAIIAAGYVRREDIAAEAGGEDVRREAWKAWMRGACGVEYLSDIDGHTATYALAAAGLTPPSERVAP